MSGKLGASRTNIHIPGMLSGGSQRTQKVRYGTVEGLRESLNGSGCSIPRRAPATGRATTDSRGHNFSPSGLQPPHGVPSETRWSPPRGHQDLDAFRDLALGAEARKQDFAGRSDGSGKDHLPLPTQGSGTPPPPMAPETGACMSGNDSVRESATSQSGASCDTKGLRSYQRNRMMD